MRACSASWPSSTGSASRDRLSSPQMASRTIELFFDFVSPYAYLASQRIGAIARAHGATLRLRPVLFAALLGHHGQLGPAEIPAKRRWLVKDVLRQAAKHGIALTYPKAHPFNPLLALRIALEEVSGDRQADVVAAIWRAAWVDRVDVASPDALAGALDAAGFAGEKLVAAANEPRAKQALKEAGDAAIQAGVFGVPTLLVDGELFWGSDRLDDLEAFLEGRDPAADVSADAILRELPVGAQRKR